MLPSAGHHLANSIYGEMSQNKNQDALSSVHSMIVARAASVAREGHLSKAEELLSPLTTYDHSSVEAINLLGKVYAQQGMMERAKALWKRALEIDPLNAEAVKALERCTLLQRHNLYAFRISIVAPLILPLLLVCAVLVFDVSSTSMPSRDLCETVRKALLSNEKNVSLSLSVIQDDMDIRIVGEVPDLRTRYLVETTASSVPGVKRVDLRGLRLMEMYEVQPGDSLWSIAERMYGNPNLWNIIAESNALPPDGNVKIGQRLCIPRLQQPIG